MFPNAPQTFEYHMGWVGEWVNEWVERWLERELGAIRTIPGRSRPKTAHERVRCVLQLIQPERSSTAEAWIC